MQKRIGLRVTDSNSTQYSEGSGPVAPGAAGGALNKAVFGALNTAKSSKI